MNMIYLMRYKGESQHGVKTCSYNTAYFQKCWSVIQQQRKC